MGFPSIFSGNYKDYVRSDARRQDMESEFEKKVAEEYDSRFKNYGAQPKSSLWFSEHRQNLRFDIIIDYIKRNPGLHDFSINDIGCGYGGFLKRLQDNFNQNSFSYAGFDLAKNPIAYCERNYVEKGVQFFCSGIPLKMADYSVMSGTFNYAPDLNIKAWKNYLFKTLNVIWSLTRRSMVFNLMISDKEKISSQSISYIKKETIVEFCEKNFGKTYDHYSPSLPREITFCVDKI